MSHLSLVRAREPRPGKGRRTHHVPLSEPDVGALSHSARVAATRLRRRLEGRAVTDLNRLNRMSENDLQTVVIQTAQLYGWKVCHFRPAKTDKGWRTPIEGDKGFPDLVLARDGEVLMPELKSQRGRLTIDQEEWGLHLGDAYRLWRPGDIPEIVEELKRPSSRPPSG